MNASEKIVNTKKADIKKRPYTAPTVVVLNIASVTGTGNTKKAENPSGTQGPGPS